MHRGYVHLWRKMLESSVWERGSLHFQIWSHILIRASGTGTTLPDGTVLKRGQFKTSFGEVQGALKYRYGRGWKYPAMATIKKSISCLNHDRMIDLYPDQTGILISVCNYELYNPLKNESCPVSEPEGNSYRIGHESIYKKDYKEGYKEKSLNLPPDGGGQASALPPPPVPPEPEIVRPRKPRKPKAPKPPADPLTNPNTFIDRVMEGQPGFVLLNRGKVSVHLQTILRELGKVTDDPQGILWGLWEKFQGGTYLQPDKFPMSGRALDLDTFTNANTFNLLRQRIERIERNGPARGEDAPSVDQAEGPASEVESDEKRAQRLAFSPHAALWARVGARLERRMQRQSFETWFVPVFIDRIEAGVVVLDVPSRLFVEWIGEHYMETIIEAMKAEGVDVERIDVEVYRGDSTETKEVRLDEEDALRG